MKLPIGPEKVYNYFLEGTTTLSKEIAPRIKTSFTATFKKMPFKTKILGGGSTDSDLSISDPRGLYPLVVVDILLAHRLLLTDLFSFLIVLLLTVIKRKSSQFLCIFLSVETNLKKNKIINI